MVTAAAMDDRGFTLLELLVVLVVIGLLAAVAPPYVQAALARMETEQASDDVVAALAEARNSAMAGNRTIRVVLDGKGRSIDVEGGRWRKLGKGVTLSLAPSGPDGRAAIVFHPDGSSSGGNIVVAGRGQAWSLMVEELTGKVRRRHAGPG